MERLFKHPGLYIAESKINGYGVFSDKVIGVGELIEQMPVHKTKVPYVWMSELMNHTEEGDPRYGFDKAMQFYFPYLHPDSSDPVEQFWIGSGFCMHLNDNGEEGNVAWVIKEKDCDCPDEQDMASFFATYPIVPGDELTIPYMHYENYDTYKKAVLDTWNIKKK